MGCSPASVPEIHKKAKKPPNLVPTILRGVLSTCKWSIDNTNKSHYGRRHACWRRWTHAVSTLVPRPFPACTSSSIFNEKRTEDIIITYTITNKRNKLLTKDHVRSQQQPCNSVSPVLIQSTKHLSKTQHYTYILGVYSTKSYVIHMHKMVQRGYRYDYFRSTDIPIKKSYWRWRDEETYSNNIDDVTTWRHDHVTYMTTSPYS